MPEIPLSQFDPSTQIRPSRRRWLTLAAQEPFRVFFPMACLFGLIGIALWPLFHAGMLDVYPGVPHARLLIHGFMTGFIIGFLGTSIPKMLEVRSFSGLEMSLLLLPYSLSSIFHLCGLRTAGDASFLALLTLLAGFVAHRFRERRDLPPPGFVLAALGLLCGAVGTICLGLATHANISPVWYRFGKQLLYQAFPLFPLLGVGPFLLPRFFGLKPRHRFADSRFPTRQWTKHALVSLAVGIVILLGIALDVFYQSLWGRFVGALAAAFFAVLSIPGLWKPAIPGHLATGLQIGLALVIAGLFASATLAVPKLVSLHLLFIGGFSLITLLVGTRVVLGHSGYHSLFRGRMAFLGPIIALYLVALAFRIVADLLPALSNLSYSLAAFAWICGTLYWAIRVLPKIRFEEAEGVSS